MGIALLSFLADYSVLISMVTFTKIHYLISTVIGYTVGVVINYILSIKWAFKSRRFPTDWKKEFGIFLLIELSALIMLSTGMFFLRHFFKFTITFAKIISNSVAAVWNYILKYKLLFKRMKKRLFPTPHLENEPLPQPLPERENGE